MTQREQILELVVGFANGFITDNEFNDMCDLVLNEITTIKK